MSDISIVWKATAGDFVLAGADLQSGDDLATAVVISLFTDRVAQIDDMIPDGSGDPRGWHGDDPAAPIGSRLWLIFRGKRTQQTLTDAQSYAQEALQWLVDDGVIADFDIDVEWQTPSTLAMRVTLFKTDGTQRVLAYAWVWN